MTTTGKERLWNTEYIKIMLNNFGMYFSFYLLTPLLPLYLHDTFGSTKDMIGIVLSGYTLTALLFRPFSGFLVDAFSRKKMLVLFLFVYFLTFGGYLMASTLLLFAIVRTFHGIPFGASTVACSTVAIDVLPSSRRNEGIGYYGLSNNIATAIAPTVGIYIYTKTHDFRILFWLAFIAAGLGMLVASTVKIKQRPLKREGKLLSLDRFFLTRGWAIAANLVFFGFCYGVLSNYLAIYGRETLGITSGTGAFFMILSIGLILSRLQGSSSLRKGNLTKNALEGIIISTLGYILFVAYPHMAGYYLSAFLIGLGNGHMYPAHQNMMINVAHSNERGTANSSVLTAWDVGQGAGILSGGVVAQHLGYISAFWMVASVQFFGLLFFLAVTTVFFQKRKLR
jgi:MFS family permease